MSLLALELSQQDGSLALVLPDGQTVERSWTSDRSRPQQLFTELGDVLKAHRVTPADIRTIAVGRGPGNFSGLRTAITTAQAFARPHGATVYAVSSGAALARALIAQHGAPVVVFGDARRDSVWFATFEDVNVNATWRTSKLADFLAQIPHEGILASSDWPRLENILTGRFVGRKIDAKPTAKQVAELVAERISRGVPTENVAPIYMHPPV